MKPASDAHAREWATLQSNIEQYERHALWVKLIAVVLSAQLGWLGLPLAGIALVLVLWLQEAIFRTSQSRLGDRILHLEQNPDAVALKLHSDWQARRPGTMGLIKEYLAQSIRPTVAFPYPVLVFILLAFAVF